MRARETQAAQQRAETRKLSPRAYRRRRALGWSPVVAGIALAVSHWLSHLGLWGFASQGVEDLIAGYPLAALLGISGAVVLSKA
jgi:hypothetical protein